MIDDPARYEFLTCGECGIRFAAPKHFIQARRDGDQRAKNFYCPNGHSRVFRESEVDRLRRERDNLIQQTARIEDDRAAAWRAEAAATAAKKKAEAALKRTINRAGAGICPCCKRHFLGLALHMRNKHPGIVPMAAKTKRG